MESSTIKKGIKNIYIKFLTKDYYLFIYLNLKIDPYKIDINIYPNKFKVSLFN
jgi:DNA mismatch repair ATPase MutL